jgi:hypothetical protein
LREEPFLLICGFFCLYPLIFWALPAFLIGRYRPRFRSPIEFEDNTGPTAKPTAKPAIQRLPRTEDKVGFGPTNRQ